MVTEITFPCFTSTVVGLLGAGSDKRLNDLVRTGRIRPAPRVIAGRRLWDAGHVRQAAIALGTLTPELERLLDAESEVSSHG